MAALIRAAFYVIVITILGVVLVTSGCEYAERANVRNIVPKPIALEGTLTAEYLSNFDVSYGVGVYALSDQSAQEILTHGLSYFDDLSLGRSDKWRFSRWEEGALKGLCREDNPVVRYRMFDPYEYLTDTDRITYTGYTNFRGSVMVFPEDKIVVTCFAG